MTRSPSWALAAKDAGALLPSWVLALLAGIAAALSNGGQALSLVAFGGIAVSLGAQSLGHEYARGTLGTLLMLPLPRRRLLGVKLAVVAVMVLPLAAFAAVADLFPGAPAMPWLMAAGALTLAPWLTMVSRSQLAGTLFPGAIAGTLYTLVMTATGVTWSGGDDTALAVRLWSALMLAAVTGGAIFAWRRFMRLEVIDGNAGEVHPRWRSVREVKSSSPLWQLVKKELRLQQLTFAVAGVYLLLWAAGLLFRPSAQGADSSVLQVLRGVYVLSVPLLVGSLATAEERQLGTLGWQLQLPMPVWQQWTAKAAVVFGLALLLSVGLPLLLAGGVTDAPGLRMFAALAIVITAGSLYISSLVTTGLHAAVVSLAVIPIAIWLVAGLALAAWRGPAIEFGLLGGRLMVLLPGIVVLLAGFAFVNYRPEPPPAARISRQALSLVAVTVAGIVALGAIQF